MSDDPKDDLDALRELEEKGVPVSRRQWAKASGFDDPFDLNVFNGKVPFSAHVDKAADDMVDAMMYAHRSMRSGKTKHSMEVLASSLRDLAKDIKVSAYGWRQDGFADRLREHCSKALGRVLKPEDFKVEHVTHDHVMLSVNVGDKLNANGDAFPRGIEYTFSLDKDRGSLRDQLLEAGRRWLQVGRGGDDDETG